MKVIAVGRPFVHRLPVSVIESPKLYTALYFCAAAARNSDEHSATSSSSWLFIARKAARELPWKAEESGLCCTDRPAGRRAESRAL